MTSANSVTTGNIAGNLSGNVAGRDIHQTTFAWPRPEPAAPETLARAQDRLAQLPADRLPPPAPLPPGSRMLHARNPLFVGRKEDLLTLARALKQGHAAIGQIAAASGLGGIGKTQLAVEFVHRYGQYFSGGVYWLSFAEAGNIPAEVAACAVAAGPPGVKSLPQPEQLQLALSAWMSPLPRLLIFDNCEEENLLTRWRPSGGGCRILLTSRRGRWSKSLGVQNLSLGVLQPEESVALLQKHRPDLQDRDAAAIAETLGNLPLALHLAGSYLGRYASVSAAEYLRQLQAETLQHASMQGRGSAYSPTGHELHVANTFALSYKALQPKDPIDGLALNLLARAVYFAPGEAIPRALLLKTIKSAAPPAAKGMWASIKRLFSGQQSPQSKIVNLKSIWRTPCSACWNWACCKGTPKP